MHVVTDEGDTHNYVYSLLVLNIMSKKMTSMVILINPVRI